jgi:hypothetical protein
MLWKARSLRHGNAGQYWTAMKDLTPDTLRVVTAAVPILAAAWVLRFVLRLALQNVAAQDDARMRASLTETYLRLASERGEAALTKDERLLALAALFELGRAVIPAT